MAKSSDPAVASGLQIRDTAEYNSALLRLRPRRAKFPVVERADVLSLEVTTIKLPRSRAQTAGGRAVEVDGAALALTVGKPGWFHRDTPFTVSIA